MYSYIWDSLLKMMKSRKIDSIVELTIILPIYTITFVNSLMNGETKAEHQKLEK